MQVGLCYDPAAPVLAEDVYRDLYRTVVRMGASFGLDDPEGSAQEFFTRMIRNGHLAKYDATKGRSLKTYVLEMFRLRRQDFKRDQVRRTERELPIALGIADRADQAHSRHQDPGATDPDLVTIEAVSDLRYVLASLPAEGEKKLDGPRLLAEMAARATHGGDLTDIGLARHFGVSQTLLRTVKATLATDEVHECLVA